MSVLKVSEGANRVAIGSKGLTIGSTKLSSEVLSLNQATHELIEHIQQNKESTKGITTEELIEDT